VSSDAAAHAAPSRGGSRLRRLGHLKDTVWRLVRVELAARHRGSALGWLWALGPPLLLLGATYFVFTRVVPLDVSDYPVFLLTGILGWTLFARGVGEGTSAIEQRRELALRPGFELELLPLTAVLVALVDYALALPVLVVALAITTGIHASWLLLPVVIGIEVVLCAGLALILSPLQIFLRDVRQLVGVAIAVGFWLTPVFYERSQVPSEISWLYDLNPMQYLLEAQRELLIEGSVPDAGPIALVVLGTAGILAVGLVIFARLRDSVPEQM
jgi:ABC-type polysaccharide/polyol phosphate export permease